MEVKGRKNKKGAPLRTDFGLGGADIVTLNQARDRALEYRRMAKQGLNPRFDARQEAPAFYADLNTRKAMAAKALMCTCLTGSRTGEALGLRW
ncbi:hypothetical protein [Parasedimentitalea psychrophila]|uniref:Integrase n=1 Tax=Parasedimentitalea psychrophila TaxID=2997337 RepID=A0A9Y2L656_9RHOB|nr:hypothetical protein [Parasedimentitalea psychrophila]WIY27634.1 hypothetical protein QPJ95_16470 [Parasedimentitalea psychrophila]